MELRTTAGANVTANTNDQLATNAYLGKLTEKNTILAGCNVGLSGSTKNAMTGFLNGRLAYNSDEGISNPKDGAFATGGAEISSKLVNKPGTESGISLSSNAEAGYRINSIKEYHENISTFGSLTHQRGITTLATGGKVEYKDENSGVYTAAGIQTDGRKTGPYLGVGINLSITSN